MLACENLFLTYLIQEQSTLKLLVNSMGHIEKHAIYYNRYFAQLEDVCGAIYLNQITNE